VAIGMWEHSIDLRLIVLKEFQGAWGYNPQKRALKHP